MCRISKLRNDVVNVEKNYLKNIIPISTDSISFKPMIYLLLLRNKPVRTVSTDGHIDKKFSKIAEPTCLASIKKSGYFLGY